MIEVWDTRSGNRLATFETDAECHAWMIETNAADPLGTHELSVGDDDVAQPVDGVTYLRGYTKGGPMTARGEWCVVYRQPLVTTTEWTAQEDLFDG